MADQMDPQNFYQSLNIFNSLRDVLDSSLYTPLPDDWHVVVADIRGSTDAIRLGKYKEVNMAGASIIAALSNAYGKELSLPYLFGGDGSMIVLPDYETERTRRLMAFCREAVKEAYGLRMDIGLISVKQIRENGHDISIARLRLSENMDQAVFWGSGCTFAEDLVKRHDMLSGVTPEEADFTGLECRWNEVPSRYDEVSAYIIQAIGDSDEEITRTYEDCFDVIEEIYGGENEFHPLHHDALSMTARTRSLKVEWQLKVQPPTIGKKLRMMGMMAFQYLAGTYLMKTGKKTSETDWEMYQTDIIKHADYKKFGDGLSFVATGKVDQRMKLSAYLHEKFREKKLVYGVHPSFAAMITCYVKAYQKQHIHFVDGTDGGYVKASQELKARRKELGM